jgi:hypothetical protein
MLHSTAYALFWARSQRARVKVDPVFKSLNKSQARYSAHCLVFLCWNGVKCFAQFTVLTDHNPLTHILTKPKHDACKQRLVVKLASYDLTWNTYLGHRTYSATYLAMYHSSEMVTVNMSQQRTYKRGCGCLWIARFRWCEVKALLENSGHAKHILIIGISWINIERMHPGGRWKSYLSQ